MVSEISRLWPNAKNIIIRKWERREKGEELQTNVFYTCKLRSSQTFIHFQSSVQNMVGGRCYGNNHAKMIRWPLNWSSLKLFHACSGVSSDFTTPPKNIAPGCIHTSGTRVHYATACMKTIWVFIFFFKLRNCSFFIFTTLSFHITKNLFLPCARENFLKEYLLDLNNNKTNFFFLYFLLGLHTSKV